MSDNLYSKSVYTTLITFFLVGGPSHAYAQSVLDRAKQVAEVTDGEIENNWNVRFDRRIGQPGKVTSRVLLESLRRELRETRPLDDRAELGYWHRIPPGGKKTIFVGVSDVSSVNCAVTSKDRSSCTATVHSAMSIPASLRRQLGSVVFDWAASVGADGQVRWQTDMELELSHSKDQGWRVNSAWPTLLALEEPPITSATSNGDEVAPPGLECLGLGGWGVAIGC